MMFVNVLIYGFGAHIFFKSFFPNEYQDILMNMSFKLIKIYSYAEFYLNKIYNSEQFLKIQNLILNLKKRLQMVLLKSTSTLVIFHLIV